MAQFELLGYLNQVPLAYQMRPQLGKIALAKVRKAPKQLFTGDQGQHRVPQKLQLLVVADSIFAVTGLLRLHFARLRTVGDCLLDHCPPPKMVAESFLERRDFPFLHKIETYPAIANCNVPAASQFFGGVDGVPVCAYFIKRSCSCLAAFPAGESGLSLVRSTACCAAFSASAILFWKSSDNARRYTAITSGCCGRASMDFFRFVSASAQLLPLN